MVDIDDEKIKTIFNTLRIKVFPGIKEIANLDLIEIKRNKIINTTNK